MTHVQDAEIVTSEPIAPSRLARAWGLAGLALLLGCGSVRQDGPDALPFDAVAPKLDVLRGGAEVADAPIQDVPPADAAAEGGDAATETGPDLLIDPNGEATLLGAPLVFAPTEQGFGISAVLSQGRPRELWLRIRQAGSPTWSPDVAPATPAADIAEWRFAGLQAGQRYEYEILVLGPAVDGG